MSMVQVECCQVILWGRFTKVRQEGSWSMSHTMIVVLSPLEPAHQNHTQVFIRMVHFGSTTTLAEAHSELINPNIVTVLHSAALVFNPEFTLHL